MNSIWNLWRNKSNCTHQARRRNYIITCLRKFRKRLRLVSENDLRPREDADPLTW